MGKAYSPEQREHVRQLLESGRDEESIEKETGVSDRTIRRWKLELERTGRIGKPPEARTGRHRVLSAEIEQALLDHTKVNKDMSVDDMLWWLYDKHKIVVGTRTIRRVFERKGDKVKIKGSKKKNNANDNQDDDDDGDDQVADAKDPANNSSTLSPNASTGHYQSPYAPMAAQQNMNAEQQLAQALQQQAQRQTPVQRQSSFSVPTAQMNSNIDDGDEDEETLQLQLQQIELQKRELEVKLKLRRIQSGKNTPASASRKASTPGSGTSTLYNPNLVVPTPPKRDSRSKKKIEESKRRTAERQERMLKDLERRSRRRDHLTAEWVQSKDIWPLRAQGLLADLMHQYGCYAFAQNQVDIFETMYRELYTLVDHSKNDWVPEVHDELLRERMKRKMGQLRTKMQKTGEIISRTDGYGGFTKSDSYTGEQAGAAEGDESEFVGDATDFGQQAQADPNNMGGYHPDQSNTFGHQQPVQQSYDPQQVQQQGGAVPEPQMQDPIQYEPVQDHGMQHMSYTHNMMGNQGPPQYPGMHMEGMMQPYGNINGGMGL
ncbi:Putative Homeobox-like domain superfamily protein [Septoria linicola]|uniref:Homeobox-like domain superfamily protein n=1 Tax=Septoria linicola TaxID=215465 RepID=A0A9Q9AZM4_9PEZI|nr:putative Homeobox-like domain superfamily protein [Septoria linicola]USW54792.1 Putative Homeobox-like domain superfamily protein [Septoria linicola]